MDTKTSMALEGAIIKWDRILRGELRDRGGLNCPLCRRFLCQDRFGKDTCTGCPVAEKVKLHGCKGTPYFEFLHASTRGWAATPEAREAAKKELEFLKSLRED